MKLRTKHDHDFQKELDGPPFSPTESSSVLDSQANKLAQAVIPDAFNVVARKLAQMFDQVSFKAQVIKGLHLLLSDDHGCFVATEDISIARFGNNILRFGASHGLLPILVGTSAKTENSVCSWRIINITGPIPDLRGEAFGTAFAAPAAT